MTTEVPKLSEVEKVFQEFITKNGIGCPAVHHYKRCLSIFRAGFESVNTDRAVDLFVGGRLASQLKKIHEDK
jgi:hypothetical protein